MKSRETKKDRDERLKLSKTTTTKVIPNKKKKPPKKITLKDIEDE